MNGLLPALTWGTWDDADFERCRRDGAASSAVSPREAYSDDAEVAAQQSAKSRRKLQKKGLRAPRDSRQWFEELQQLVDASPFGGDACVYSCNPLQCAHSPDFARDAPVIPWDALPEGIHPRDGKLPPLRARNKRQQVENLAVFLRRILRPGDVVVEFCAGSGYVALPLACLFPACKFVLLDKKAPSLAIAEERVAAAKLSNVEIFCGFIDEYDQPFDVGIALHACGEATDMAMEKCLKADAAYVMAPCCVGKIKLSALEYPRSDALTSTLSRTEFEVLARAADFGHSSTDALSHSDANRRRRRCKTLLERDRNARAEEAGYRTFMFVMHPRTATPKNDVLVGFPSGWSEHKLLENDEGCDTALFKWKLTCSSTVLTAAETRNAIFGSASE